MQPAPVFGKRSAAPSRGAVRAAPAAREEQESEVRPRAVPRSFRAALLAGLVVGCCLAGLDATQAGATLHALSHGALSIEAAPRMLPLVIALALYGGARAAATSLLVAHAVLRRLAQAGFLDASLATHGLAFDVAASLGAGFLYRVFAGAALVEAETR